MTMLQRSLQRACHDLGLTVVVPFLLNVRDGIQIEALALLPQLGYCNGMIIVDHYDDLQGAAEELPGKGYGYCVLGEPQSSEEFDLESFIGMFSDWGWNNTAQAPRWMRH